jgi:hypothetical protein
MTIKKLWIVLCVIVLPGIVQNIHAMNSLRAIKYGVRWSAQILGAPTREALRWTRVTASLLLSTKKKNFVLSRREVPSDSIFDACKKGIFFLLKNMIRIARTPDLFTPNSYGELPFHIALEYRNNNADAGEQKQIKEEKREAIDYYFKRACEDAAPTVSSLFSDLVYACDAEMVRAALSTVEEYAGKKAVWLLISGQLGDFDTPLNQAVAYGNVDMVKVLLEAAGNRASELITNDFSGYGNGTLLDVAYLNHGSGEITKLLLHYSNDKFLKKCFNNFLSNFHTMQANNARPDRAKTFAPWVETALLDLHEKYPGMCPLSIRYMSILRKI